MGADSEVSDGESLAGQPLPTISQLPFHLLTEGCPLFNASCDVVLGHARRQKCLREWLLPGIIERAQGPVNVVSFHGILLRVVSEDASQVAHDRVMLVEHLACRGDPDRHLTCWEQICST